MCPPTSLTLPGTHLQQMQDSVPKVLGGGRRELPEECGGGRRGPRRGSGESGASGLSPGAPESVADRPTQRRRRCLARRLPRAAVASAGVASRGAEGSMPAAAPPPPLHPAAGQRSSCCCPYAHHPGEWPPGAGKAASSCTPGREPSPLAPAPLPLGGLPRLRSPGNLCCVLFARASCPPRCPGLGHDSHVRWESGTCPSQTLGMGL